MRTGIRRTLIGVGFSSLVMGAIAGCGTTSADTPSPPAAAVTPSAAGTPITLSEMSVAMATAYPVGKHTFTITNAGTIPHELLVFRSALTVDKYPRQASGAIDEEGPGITKISDGDNLDKGQSQNRDVDLSQPGSYLFVCNLPGHFAAHMYSVVTVG